MKARLRRAWRALLDRDRLPDGWYLIHIEGSLEMRITCAKVEVTIEQGAPITDFMVGQADLHQSGHIARTMPKGTFHGELALS